MMLNKAYKRFLNWKDDRDRKNYDFTWMKEAQEKYPEAFEKTSEFINSVEDDCHKVGMESGKLVVFSTGGLLWTIIVGVMTWTVTHLDDPWLTSSIVMVGNYQGRVFIGSAFFVLLEMVRFIINQQTNINERTLDRLKNKWQEILNKPIPKSKATQQIELFIAQEQSYNIRYLVKSSSSNWLGNKTMIILQFAVVIFVVWNGFWQLDAHSRTVRETEHQQCECKPKLECAQRAS
ncbi:hypothetical protein [Acetobacter orientalis]|uniref:hypothetical protein n=1 Tax=Acetobacter orientalis TaxID=146474 RepID=UPI0039EC91E9